MLLFAKKEKTQFFNFMLKLIFFRVSPSEKMIIQTVEGPGGTVSPSFKIIKEANDSSIQVCFRFVFI